LRGAGRRSFVVVDFATCRFEFGDKEIVTVDDRERVFLVVLLERIDASPQEVSVPAFDDLLKG
jgi:hypothetical protein